jgi:hypothetical protein
LYISLYGRTYALRFVAASPVDRIRASTKGFPSLFRSNEPVPFWAGALCHRFAFFVMQSILLPKSLAEGSQQDLSLSLSTKLGS